jgi:hypothetical protein
MKPQMAITIHELQVHARKGLALFGAMLLLLLAATDIAAEPAWKEKPERSNEGEVQFNLTPRDVSGGRFRVDIIITAHSGDLSQLDLRQAVTLRIGGQTLQPVKVPTLRGHHVRGRMEFALSELPERFEIVIAGPRGMGDITFRWP